MLRPCSPIKVQTASFHLREAIIAVNSDSASGYTITLGAGTFTLSIGGVNEDASATGDLDITSDITIVGAGMLSTIIDANDIDRVFDVLCRRQVWR